MEWNVVIARSVETGSLPAKVISEMEKGEFFAAESFCLDFKREGYSEEASSLAEAVKDIASFYNSYGGFIVFGIEEVEKDVRYRVVGIRSTPFNMQLLRGKVESWLSDDIPFSYHELTIDELKVGVIFVPKRKGARPNQFKRRGPEVRPGKFIFDAGDVAVRRSDKSTIASEMSDWQLALGERGLDAIASDLGRIVAERRSGAALDHNLPSRAVICAQFVGRADVLTQLWAWLNDEFQYAKVIAGEGGKGKTSVAYEFVTQVAYVAPLGIERIVWLTAKKRQFSGIENTWKSMPETHFESFRTMLEAIGKNLPYSDDELSSASESELQRMVRSAIGIQPTLFVLDDIDSLTPDEQRRALEFAQQAGSEQVRFLLTTRSNASYSTSAAITLGGLEGEEYKGLVSVLADRFKVSLPPGAVRELEAATHGSPLLTESVLRVVRRGSTLRKAIEEWRNQSGEDARNAVLGREISQLSREAQRVLLCMAFLGQCSKAELVSASGLLEIKLGDALEELQSLFIVNAPKIIESEPRFEIGVTVALLVISKRADLAGDHAAIEKRIRAARQTVAEGSTQRHNKDVAKAISQSLALKTKDYAAAVETIDAALKSTKNHPDLLLFKGRMLLEARPPQRKEARRLFGMAYEKGVRKHILFDLWYKCEREIGFGPGVIEAADSALKEFPAEEALWGSRRAEGHVLNGLARLRNREFDQAFDDLSSAARELSFAQKRASESELLSMEEYLCGVHDQLLSIMPNLTNMSRTAAVSLIREITDRGDTRMEVIGAMATALSRLARELSARKSIPSDQRDRFENNRMYLLDLLRMGGREGAVLHKQISELRLAPR